MSVRNLIVACLPAAAIGFVANSPTLGAAFTGLANQGLTVDDNTGASTNGPAAKGPNTNNSGGRTNIDQIQECIQGVRG